MDDASRLRELLEEPDPPPESRERVRAALRLEYEREAGRRKAHIPQRRRRLAVGSTGSAVLLLLLLWIGAWPEMVSAWAPTPVDPPDPALVERARTECGDDPDPLPPPLVVDQRGSTAAVLFGDTSGTSASTVACFLSSDGDGWERSSRSDFGDIVSASGHVDEEVLGAPVERVVVDRDNQRVRVSYRDGHFLIWWPDHIELHGAQMRFLSVDGTVLLELPLQSNRSP